MALTLGNGPLARARPHTVNYRIDGPSHLLYAHPFPRRVRAELGGATVLDSERGLLVHETGLLPVLYVPFEDISGGRLSAAERRTHCPYKGDASYWDVSAGGRRAQASVWAYPDPLPDAAWLIGMAAIYWEAMDAWYDEEERVRGHLRDPYHRVDVRQSRKLVRVSLEEHALARTGHPKVLSETGLPNRYYLPREDVDFGLLVPSRTRTHCPYKGDASYWSLRLGGREIADVAWSYQHPLKDGRDIMGYLCFAHEELTVAVEDQPEHRRASAEAGPAR